MKTAGFDQDAVEVKVLDERLAVDDLGVVVEGPTEQGEEVDDGVREVALIAVLEGGVGAVALRELGAVRPEDAGKMREGGRLPTKRLIDEDVPRRAGEPFVAAQDVGDLHEVIVDQRGEMVRRVAVGLERGRSHRALSSES